ncbi:RNA-binding transcriptional accessory protein [Chitiniphilus purpureus]|uniref:RNA-binding transcriptional accessory protein n=1 Tax=Chitiniphilus purpureus TaxID=2981137 RepID=A0ABY6DRT1_9NEIS|nr:Tex family protein [Chitiniphilus sp. CD1]UXY17075.1 RNA-binding transcriptional accessory protein [Chitiniphilus sp. CD1]
MLPPISQRLAAELACRPQQVEAAIQLFDEGATVPFVARYRKEATGGLDDTQLRTLDERLRYLRELEERRASVIASVQEQGKLTEQLHADLLVADNKQRLEDLYLPYKPRRRTRAQIAREAGLQPLADSLLADPGLVPEHAAAAYLNEQVADAKAALDGARAILMEAFAEDAGLIGTLRDHLAGNGVVKTTVVEGKAHEGAKFSDYFDYSERLAQMPSHRVLAVLRGRNEGVLDLALLLPDELDPAARPVGPNVCELKIAQRFGIENQGRPGDKWLADTVRLAWRAKIFLSLESDLINTVRERAELDAIKVFASNLKDLLLAAPAGPRATLGLDPGLRTGVKVAVVDATGKLVDTATLYPHEPRNEWDKSIAALAALAARHKVELIAIGNGTASRETDRLAAELIKRHPELALTKLVVSEAGASVYSASELAAREFPTLDVSLRGAVSIARRLQDPLAELVKIEPKAIGVGQYQHDVNQGALARTLDAVVEDCVNAVGVDLNTASAALLARVSGLSSTLAGNIVQYRDVHGAFADRKALLQVPRLGEKTFEQAAGFLRVPGGTNPLDASAVHPEAYPVVEKIIAKVNRNVKALIGDSGFLRQLAPADFTDERFGLPTVRDIIAELEKPGRDPRPEFKTASFAEGVEDLKDLQCDMVLEGVVTNVTNFGAFVDIGVHQDGLVHISALSNRFVKDPREVVKAGDVVKVKVLEVDLKRRRVALSMRLSDSARDHAGADAARIPAGRAQKTAPRQAEPQGAMAAALAGLKLTR